MGDDFRIEGMDSLEALAKVMRKVGDGKEIRKELLAALRAAGTPTADDMRTELAAKLPKRGGASKYLTKKKRTFAVRNRLSSSAKESAGIRIVSTDKGHDYNSLERRGTLRHPVYPWRRRPRRSWRWVEQKVPTAGLLEGVLDDHQDEFLDGIGEAMTAAAAAIEQAISKEV
ncbi:MULTISPECIES: hypothetical protein [unclassified Isoptericola]|uniref:hypothetical protein n=1 Tax=unclassified Isoptericola TaxID=2623355 RepID=UPI003667E723